MNRFALILLLLMLFGGIWELQAFDIAVYMDGRSGVNWRSQSSDSMMCGQIARQTAIENIDNQEALFQWLDSMRVTCLIPLYPFADDFDYFAMCYSGPMKIYNYAWPVETYKYLEAQNRDFFPWDQSNRYVDDGNLSWKAFVTKVARPVGPNQTDVQVLEANSSVADTMWRATSDLGIWQGWDRRDGPVHGKIYMPMHFRITCNLIPDSTDPPSETQEIATFYWLVANDSDGNGQVDSWWRYPAHVMRTEDFQYPTQLDEIEFEIDPTPDSAGTFCKVDTTFQDTLGFANNHAFTFGIWGAQVRMSIFYHGDNQAFQFYKFEAWDEGYHRLLVSADTSDWHDSIKVIFQNNYQTNKSKGLGGWYYDEWQQPEMVKPFVKVNRLMEEAGVPTMIVNGHYGYRNCDHCYRNLLFEEMEAQGVNLTVHMDEMYFLSGTHTCRHWTYMMWTDTLSDTTYIECDPTDCEVKWGLQLYHGRKSLQCSIDEYLFGSKPLYDNYDVCDTYQWLYDDNLSVVEQVAHVHEEGKKFWAMVAGDDDWPDDSYDPNQHSVIRMPTPNEVKLSAWLAVACDADGLLWYPVEMGSGLFDWSTPNVDWCLVGNETCDNVSRLMCGDTASIVPTPRYYAAKEACTDIQQIAPILESMDFTRTYASRAYETNYPSQMVPPTHQDDFYIEDGRHCWLRRMWTKSSSFNLNHYDLDARTFSDADSPDSTYVQVSRFIAPGMNPRDEDYWFLVINRRALTTEPKAVCISLDGLGSPSANYSVDFILQKQHWVTINTDPWDPFDRHPDERFVFVTLLPGEAELIHFYREQSDLVLDGGIDTTITAPVHLSRNIILRDAKLTIKPDSSRVHDWDTVSTVYCWPGKSIIVEDAGGADADTAKLRILGNDSIRLVFQPIYPDSQWAGIQFRKSYGDTLIMKHAEIKGASAGVSISGSTDIAHRTTEQFLIDSCAFLNCGTGLNLITRVFATVSNTNFQGNHTGITCFAGSYVNVSQSSFTENTFCAVNLIDALDADFDDVVFEHNGLVGNNYYLAAIRVFNSTAEFRCCSIDWNTNAGISAISSSIVMADSANEETRWGHNSLAHNDTTFGGHQLFETHSEGLILDHGMNRIIGDTTDALWVYSTGSDTCPRYWRQNYWGTTNTDIIEDHVPADVIFEPVQSTWVNCDGIVEDTSDYGEGELFLSGKKNAKEEQYEDATNAFKDVVGTTPTCRYARAAIREILNTDLLAEQPDASYSYFKEIVENAADAELVLAAGYAQAWSAAYSGDMSTAHATLEDVTDTASTELNVVRGKVASLALDMVEQNSTDSAFVSLEEMQAVLDSINHLVASLHVWSQYVISDSVTMYAPCRVDSQIYIEEGGVLTIVPQPGIKNPVVTFCREGSIFVDGYPPYSPPQLPRGALIVRGEADNPVTLLWAGITDTAFSDIYSCLGFVQMKHAKLIGGSWMNLNDMPYGRQPILQVDSCTFESFGEGMWCWGTNDSSYIRNSTFRHLGLDHGVTIGNYFGTGLSVLECNRLDVENCTFEDNTDVGLLFFDCNEANLVNTEISGSGQSGIVVWDGNLMLDCVTATDNGDTLPELWVDAGLVNLVGAHTEFADSSGTLIYSADPSYIDLEEGENGLHLWSENGLYLKSGDTTATWDITWNNWSPATPADQDFYDYLYPHTPSKWTVDSSLIDFIACDQGGAMGWGGGNWLIVGSENETPGIQSHGGSVDPELAALSEEIGPVKKNASGGKSTSDMSRKGDSIRKNSKPNRADAVRQHHEELAKWREFKQGTKTKGELAAQEVGMQFIDDFPTSDFIPAVLVKLAALADQDDTSVRISSYLQEQVKRLPDSKDRIIAERLSYNAMAKEGRPAEALQGLQVLMETAETPQDSIRALVDAMGVYFFHGGAASLQPRFAQVRNGNIKQLAKRVVELAAIMNDPSLKLHGRGAPVPQAYKLYQNYPNPFNPVTEIQFDLPEAVRVELKVFNILGQEVATLLDAVRPAGAYHVRWDSRSASGVTVGSGVYIYQLKAGSFVDSKKMVLIR